MIMDNTWPTLPITHRMTDPVGPPSKHYLDRSMLNFHYRSYVMVYIVPERHNLRFLLFSIVLLLCHSHKWIINEGIVHFKNEYNFWIARAKKVRNVKFNRSNSIISKITSPSFLQFLVLKGTSGWKLCRSDVTPAQNRKFKLE